MSIGFESLTPSRAWARSQVTGFAAPPPIAACLIGYTSSAADQISNNALIGIRPTNASRLNSPFSTSKGTASACEPKGRDALQDRISEQLLALNRRDFSATQDQASPSFKATFDPRGFEEKIWSGFPFLLDQSSVAFGRCRIEGETGSLEVRFGEGSSIALLHLFVKTQVGWWIDGASPADDAVTRKVETS